MSAKVSGKAYISNAQGAVIGGAVMLAVSLVLSVLCARKALATDWGCAFSGDAAACLASAPEKTQQCQHPTVDRHSAIWSLFSH